MPGVSVILADLLVLSVTWYQTYETVRMSRRVAGQDKRTLASTLLRDGTWYNLVLHSSMSHSCLYGISQGRLTSCKLT